MSFQAIDPRTGDALPGVYEETTAAEVDALAEAAARALAERWDAGASASAVPAATAGDPGPVAPARFADAELLRAVADAIEADAAALLAIAARETGLAEARLTGELARTTAQLRAFAEVVDRGEALDPIIDTARPDATPPRPDQRRATVPIGPVAVFAAGNFPFAFGVAGGDTAAAWAAGCPVIVKAHPGYPGTSQRTADAIGAALERVGAPAAWFALVEGREAATGMALAAAEPLAAVAFTGSLAVGTALVRAAAQRPRPIPVFAEMGSTNPLLVTPRAAAARGPAIAAGLAAAIAGSAGQLCTKPGLVALVDDEAGRPLVAALAGELARMAPMSMLSPGQRDRFADALAAAVADGRTAPRVEPPAHAPAITPRPAPSEAGGRPTDPAPSRPAGAWQAPALLETRAAALRRADPLLEELFGPAALVVWCADEAELVAFACERMTGTLTATLHAEPDEPLARRLWPLLAAHAGRLVFNGYPTGVTVGRATVHGGPFPATSAPAHTSVGMTAVRRFLRPVAYQNAPDVLLPAALRDANPLGLLRIVDGEPTRAAVHRR